MTNSMTAFARTENDQPFGRLVWEIRSVNHRYLDIHLKLPEELRNLEMPSRELITAKLNRGRIDSVLKFENSTGTSDALKLNQDTLNSLAQVITQLAPYMSTLQPASVIDILRWPGVISEPALDKESISRHGLATLENTLDALIQHRQREGNRMTELIAERLAQSCEIVSGLREMWPEIELATQNKWNNRLAELVQDVDSGRINQELAMLLTKIDISEEIDRLDSHFEEVNRALTQKRPIGRRLDFLMQELIREANTLGAKSADPRTTNASVELKVLIDQMREQVQNLE